MILNETVIHVIEQIEQIEQTDRTANRTANSYQKRRFQQLLNIVFNSFLTRFQQQIVFNMFLTIAYFFNMFSTIQKNIAVSYVRFVFFCFQQQPKTRP